MKATITRSASTPAKLKFEDLQMGQLYNYRERNGGTGVVLVTRALQGLEPRLLVELKGADAGRVWGHFEDDRDAQFVGVTFTPFTDKITLSSD